MTEIKKTQTTNQSNDLKNPDDLHLSIQLSLDGFSFCITDKIAGRITLLKHFSYEDDSPTPEDHLKNVEKVISKEPLLQNKYSSVNVTHINDLSAVVPLAFFDEKDLSLYLKFSHKIFKNDFITYDKIDSHELVNVYIPFVNINNYLIDQYGSFEYKHCSTVFIESMLDTYKFSERPHMFVMVKDRHFDILAIADERLQLYNSFRYETREDFIYYILFAAEQLGFNPNQFELIFLGKTVKNDPIYNIAYQYIRNIDFLENTNKYTLNEDLKDDLQRQFFTLLHQF